MKLEKVIYNSEEIKPKKIRPIRIVKTGSYITEIYQDEQKVFRSKIYPRRR